PERCSENILDACSAAVRSSSDFGQRPDSPASPALTDGAKQPYSTCVRTVERTIHMIRILMSLAAGMCVAVLTGCNGANPVAEVFQAKQIAPEASQQLAAMAFESTPVTVRGRITMALFAVPGSTGMITVQANAE